MNRNTPVLAIFFAFAFCGVVAAQATLAQWNGPTLDSGFGNSIARIGDINADQVDDFVVGSPGPGPGYIGNAFVISGSDGSVLFQLSGASQGDCFGASVSGAGDVNGDGIPDILVGAPQSCYSSIVGGPTGPGYIRIHSGLDGSILATHYGNALGDGFGSTVSGMGDVDQDGATDVLVGAFYGEYVKVISGGNGSVIYSWNGDFPGDGFGSAVKLAGDVNADGFPDAIVGAPRACDSCPSDSYVKVFSGLDGSVIHHLSSHSNPFNIDTSFGNSVSGTGDLNADGHDDFIIAEPLGLGVSPGYGVATVYSGSDASILFSYNATTLFEFISYVSGAGDVNGDGTPDFMYRGSAVNIRSGKDGSKLFSLTAPVGDSFGASFDAAGDLNGDGLGDFIVGAVQTGSLFYEPGNGYVKVFAGSDAFFKNYGASSSSSHPLVIHGKGVPALGATVSIDVTVPAIFGSMGLLLIGTQPDNQPWLSGTLLVQPLYVIPYSTPPALEPGFGFYSISFAIPNDPTLLDTHYFFQATNLVSSASGSFGSISISDGLEMAVQ